MRVAAQVRQRSRRRARGCRVWECGCTGARGRACGCDRRAGAANVPVRARDFPATTAAARAAVVWQRSRRRVRGLRGGREVARGASRRGRGAGYGSFAGALPLANARGGDRGQRNCCATVVAIRPSSWDFWRVGRIPRGKQAHPPPTDTVYASHEKGGLPWPV